LNQAIQHAGGAGIQPVVPDVFVARRNFFNFFGISCRILTLEGLALFFIRLKAFKLREQIGVFRDEARTLQTLGIQARSILDFGATYDVTDVATGQRVGSLRRKALKSVLKDEWEILDAYEQVMGRVCEDSWLMAILRRFLSNLIPQSYTYYWGPQGEEAAQSFGEIRGTWNPFIVGFTVDLTRDPGHRFDRRLALASAVMLMTIEGKQG
jgi:hypothetical protein